MIDFYRLTPDVFEALIPSNLSEKICELFLVFFDPSFHARVPVILDGVVSTALQEVGNISPFVGLVSVEEVKDPFFLSCPSGVSLDHRV